MEPRIIPTKNYIIFSLITAISLIFIFSWIKWSYDLKVELNKSSKLRANFPEILATELDSYILENSSFVIYLSSPTDLSLQGFEKKLNQLVKDNPLETGLIYLDVDRNADGLNSKLNSYLNDNLKNDQIDVNKKATILIFKDRKVSALFSSSSQIINTENVKVFFVQNEVMELK